MTEGLSFIVGLFLPLLVELVKTKFGDNKIVSYSIALISCIVVGFITTAIGGKLDVSSLDTLVGSIGSSLLASQVVYNYYWKPQKLDERVANYINKI